MGRRIYLDRKCVPLLFRNMTKKHKVAVETVEDGVVVLTGTQWEGGSKSNYGLVKLATGERRATPASGWMEKSASVTIEPGWVVVETGMFCGKPATMTIHCRPADALALLGISTALAADAPLGIVADWLLDCGRQAEHELVRQLV